MTHKQERQERKCSRQSGQPGVVGEQSETISAETTGGAVREGSVGQGLRGHGDDPIARGCGRLEVTMEGSGNHLLCFCSCH
jgi:hypothetical protein